MIKVSIEKLSNGYIVEWSHVGMAYTPSGGYGKEVYGTLPEAVRRLRSLMGDKTEEPLAAAKEDKP